MSNHTRSLARRFARFLLCASVLIAPQAHAETVLRVRLNSDIRSTDPGTIRDANTDMVMMHILEGLVAYREDTSVGPLLAESIGVSADGMTYTFRLRPGLRFSNGAPVNASDVLFSWNRYMKPETNWRCLLEFDGHGPSKVLSVTAKDDLTIVYTLEKPSAVFLATLARADCGGTGIYHKSSLDADGKWHEPIGTGPYKLAAWKRGQSVDLVKNDSYVALPGARDGYTGNKTPLVDKVRFVIIPDSSAAKAGILSGAIDLISDVDDEDIPDYQADKDIVLTQTPTMDLVAILFQTQDPVLKDVRMRRAIALSIDLTQVVDAVTSGSGHASRSVIPRSSGFYGAPERQLPKQDLAAARKLLLEAGYKGQPIKLLANKRYRYMFDIAVVVQAMALEAGINMQIEVLDWAAMLDRYTKGDYQAMSFGYSARLDPSLSYDMLAGAKDKESRKVWDDPEALDLLAKSMEISDHAQRQALFDQLEARQREDVPLVCLYSTTDTTATRSVVHGFKNWPLGFVRGWGVSVHD